jgi:hypothetical protein
LCALYKAYTGRPAGKVIGDSLLKPCYLSREDHGREIRSRKQRTDVDKYDKQTTNSVTLVRERTIPTERPPPVGEGVAWSAQRIPTAVFSILYTGAATISFK